MPGRASTSPVLSCVPCLALFLLRRRAGLSRSRTGGLLRRRRPRRLHADGLDLDLRQAAAVAVAPAIAGAAAVLADDHLLTEDVSGHLRRHLGALERVAELRLAVASEHDQVGMEGLPLVMRQAVDEQTLAFAHAVLLPADRDDRVIVRFRCHGAKQAGSPGPLRVRILPACAYGRARPGCRASSSSWASARPRSPRSSLRRPRSVPRRALRQRPWASSSCARGPLGCRAASSSSASP